jgi:deazaflavin-dependent oxidoreductase (nitroreductase family)
MTEQSSSLPLPRGVMGWLLRLPIGLYRAHLGGLMGGRFLLLTHTGRKTGRERQTVIEVVHHDLEPETYYVVSGWGEKSNWYRNIMSNADVRIQVGNRKYHARAERVTPEKGAQVLLVYAREHPLALRELSRMMKYPLDGSEESIRNLGGSIPVIAFKITAGA